MRTRITVALSLLGAFIASAAAHAQLPARSKLALQIIGGADTPELVIAQRVIDRTWGPSDDSVYVEIDVPQWRSEGLAMGMSAALPGAGQMYVGERKRGLWFALAEGAGWVARQIYRHRGDELRANAVHYLGSPSDSSSKWSFARWAHETGGDPTTLERLYAADREAFYERLAHDPTLLAGWGGVPADTRQTFSDLRFHSDARFRYARYTAIGLWINHVAAAFDAMRAARLHNVHLAPNLGLELDGGWRNGGPTLTAAIRRRF